MSRRVRDEITIDAPVEEVFAYLDDPENSLALVPHLVEVKEVVPLPNGGHRMRFVALGRRGKLCEWVSEQVERVPNRRVVVRARTEGVETIGVRRFEETAAGTQMQAELEYRVELPWPQKVFVPVIEFQWRRPMRRQLRALLALTKARVEAG